MPSPLEINKDNFPAWQSLMKLHLGGLGDHAQSCITVEHVNPTKTPTIEDMRKMKEHNQAMLEIASALTYVEFDDIKGYDSVKKMGMLFTLFMEETQMF